MLARQLRGAEAAERWRTAAPVARHLADVPAAVPADRLLDFALGDGEAPLCDFLAVPVPEAAFPGMADAGDFWSRFGGEPAET